MEDAECYVLRLFLGTNANLVDEDQDLPEVVLVLVVVAGELLVNLLGNLSQLATVSVVQVKFSHVAAESIVFTLDRVLFGDGLPLLDFQEKRELILNIFAAFLESDDVVFGTSIGALV